MTNFQFKIPRNDSGAWILILFMVGISVFSAPRIWKKIDVKSWTEVNANVLSSEIYKRNGRGGADWCLKLKYSYEVAGKIYVSDRISPSLVSDNGCDFRQSVIEHRLNLL